MANPKKMESELEHREVPKDDAVVKPVKGQKKQHRGEKLAAGQYREPKELTWGDCGSRKKLAATCRKISCHAAVARHKRIFFMKNLTQGNCGPWKKLVTSRKSGKAQAKLCQEILDQGQCWTGNSERINGEQTLERPAMQNGNKGPNRDWHWRVEPRTVTAPGKRRKAQEDPIWNLQRENRETSSQNVQRVMKNDGLNIMEPPPPEQEKKKN